MTAEAPWAPPPSTGTATVGSVCFVVVAAIPYAGVGSDELEDWSAGLAQNGGGDFGPNRTALLFQ